MDSQTQRLGWAVPQIGSLMGGGGIEEGQRGTRGPLRSAVSETRGDSALVRQPAMTLQSNIKKKQRLELE